MADDKDLLNLRARLTREIEQAEGNILAVLARQKELAIDYAKEYGRVLAMGGDFQKQLESTAEFIQLNAQLAKGLADAVKEIDKQYGFVDDKLDSIRMSHREVLKLQRDMAQAMGDIAKAAEAQDKLKRMRRIDAASGVKTAMRTIGRGGLTTSEASADLRIAGEAAYQKGLQELAKPKGKGTRTGMIFLALFAAAEMVKMNLDQLRERIKSVNQGFSTMTNMAAVAQETRTYVYDVKNAAANYMMEAAAVQAVNDIMRTAVPGSIKSFMDSNNDATLSLQSVVQNARLLGLSEEQSAQMMTNLYRTSARQYTGEQRRLKATEEMNLAATYARRSLADNIMTTTDFTAQLDQAIAATSAFSTSAGSLGAVMDSLSRIQSRSAPSRGSVGEAAASLTNQMRGIADPLKVVLAGGLKGIWGWSEMDPTEMLKSMGGSFLSPFMGLGTGAKQEDKAVALMVMKQFGFADAQARQLIEMGPILEATQQEIAATRADAKEADATYKEIQGGVAQLVKQGDRILGYLSNISARMTNLPAAR